MILAPQTEVAVELQLQCAGFVLEQLIDDGAFAWAGCLEEGDLAPRFEGHHLPDAGAGDGRFAHEERRAFLDDVAAGAEAGGRKMRASRAFSSRPFQTCFRVSFVSPSGFTGTVAVE